MTTKYAAKHGAGLANTIAAIQNRQPFDAGNLTGSTTLSTTGKLPMAYVGEILRTRDEDKLEYVVYSYRTPIAWYGRDKWTIPAVRYSVTTSNHQGVVRRSVA